MTKAGENANLGSSASAHDPHNRLVYVMPDSLVVVDGHNAIQFGQLLRALWAGKWWIATFECALLLAALLYVFSATEWYRAEVLLVPASEKSTTGVSNALGNLAGLAAMAGVSVGGGSSVEPLAMLSSRQFAREFIADEDLLPILFEDKWDSIEQKWADSNPDNWPDIHDGAQFFINDILAIEEKEGGELISVSVAWTDAELAASWANALVDRLNAQMRQRALVEAEANVEYLRETLVSTSLVALQQAASRLLESEMQKIMLASGKDEFSFRVVDRAVPPKEPFRPMKVMILGLALVVGAVLSFGVTLIVCSGSKGALSN